MVDRIEAAEGIARLKEAIELAEARQKLVVLALAERLRKLEARRRDLAAYRSEVQQDRLAAQRRAVAERDVRERENRRITADVQRRRWQADAAKYLAEIEKGRHRRRPED